MQDGDLVEKVAEWEQRLAAELGLSSLEAAQWHALSLRRSLNRLLLEHGPDLDPLLAAGDQYTLLGEGREFAAFTHVIDVPVENVRAALRGAGFVDSFLNRLTGAPAPPLGSFIQLPLAAERLL